MFGLFKKKSPVEFATSTAIPTARFAMALNRGDRTPPSLNPDAVSASAVEAMLSAVGAANDTPANDVPSVALPDTPVPAIEIDAAPEPVATASESAAVPVAESAETGEASFAEQDLTRAGRLTRVVIPKSSFESAKAPGDEYMLPMAVVDFVNDIQQAGVYVHDEMPDNVMAAYHADYYLAQVNNGGHAQFIHNAGALLDVALKDIRAALTAMGARDHLSIFEDVAAWVAAHPADDPEKREADAHQLEALDDRFFAQQASKNLYVLAAKWIAGWPHLDVVNDDAYSAIIAGIADLNPLKEKRRLARNVTDLRERMAPGLFLAASVAVGALDEVEFNVAMGSGGYQDLGGVNSLVFGVLTNVGWRKLWNSDGEIRLYEQTDDDMRVIATATADRVEAFAHAAEVANAPVAIDLLLRNHGADPAVPVTARDLDEAGGAGAALWLVWLGEEGLGVATTEHGAKLIDANGNLLTEVTRQEIDAHAEAVAEGEATLCNYRG